MRLYLLTASLSILLAASGRAQLTHDVEFAMFAGVTNYLGDLAEYNLEYNETRPAYGLVFRYQVTPKFTVRAHYIHGTLGGNDRNSNTNRVRGYSFTAPLDEYAALLEYYPFGKHRYNNAGIFLPRLSPYIFVGGAFASARSTVVSPPDAPVSFPVAEDKSHFWVTPVGGGVRFDLVNHLNVSLEVGVRNAFSDYLDGVSAGSSANEDWYWFGGLTVGYYFLTPNPYRRRG